MRHGEITLLFDADWLVCEPYDILYRSLHGLALALIRADCEREALNKASSYDWPITNSINPSDN